jgi:hypothetical protein
MVRRRALEVSSMSGYSLPVFPCAHYLLPCIVALLPTGDGGVPRPEEYGFSGVLNSRLNDGVVLLQAGDFDSDGDIDLAVINNPKARIDFLLQRKPGEPLGDDAATRTSGRVNELVDETNFRRDSFPTEQKVSSFALGDLNGDGRNDLAFTGDSGKLTVVYRSAKGTFGDRVRFDLDEPSASPQAVRCGDLDGNGRSDVAVLARRKTQLFLQGQDGKLAEGAELLNATSAPDGFALADLDGDKKLDVLYVKAESESPLRFRLNRGGGEFGPERQFPFTELRGYTAADVDADGRSEVAAVRRRSGRLALLRFAGEGKVAKPGELVLSAPRVVAYAVQKDEKPRDELLADLDGDGRPELIVAEPSAARLVVHHADPDGLTCRGESFPSFVGARQPRVADVDRDGKLELTIAAPEEGAIGVASVEHQRLGFPAPLGYKAEQLLSIDVADVDGSGHASLYALLATGKGSKKSYSLACLGGSDALTTELKAPVPVDPSDLWLVDLNRDGLKDALVFLPTEMPRVLIAQKSAVGTIEFLQLETQDVPGLGILKGVSRGTLFHGDVDGDGQVELLVPGPNFARAFTLGPKGVPQVVGQWNLGDAGAKVGAVAAGDLDGDGSPEIVLTERTSRSIRVLKLVGGEQRTLARVDLGDLEPKSLRVADLDGNGAQDIVILCPDRFGVVQAGRSDPGFVEAVDFETPLKNAYLDDVAFGDVNSDGITDAVITETSQHRLAIAALVQGTLTHVLQFPIYEESVFERGGGGGKEPRELVLADLTGDGKTDVALLVHDRVLVYPQE